MKVRSRRSRGDRPVRSLFLCGAQVKTKSVDCSVRAKGFIQVPLLLKAAVATAVIFSASAVRIANADEVDELLDDLVRYQEKKRAVAESAMIVAEPIEVPGTLEPSRPELEQAPRAQLRSRRIRAAESRRGAVRGPRTAAAKSGATATK